MQIHEQLVASRAKTNGSGNPCIGITIHETANLSRGADAQAHANLQSKGNVRSASWHISVDDLGAIRSFPNTVKCWHAGKPEGNNKYVAIEICVNEGSDYVQACKNAAEVVRELRAQGVGRLLEQHHGFTGKDCPNFMREGRDGVTWQVFCDWVANGTGTPVPAPTPPPAPQPVPVPVQRVDEDGKWGPGTTTWQQKIAGTNPDGVISHQWKNVSNEHIYAAQFDKTQRGSTIARWIQTRLRDLGLYSGKIDGLLGDGSVYGLQSFYGTPRDIGLARISPISAVVKAMQREINAGSFLGIRG